MGIDSAWNPVKTKQSSDDQLRNKVSGFSIQARQRQSTANRKRIKVTLAKVSMNELVEQ